MRTFSINVVLVRTIYDSNIGASSRAMANMGAQRLILIDPKCEIKHSTHQAAASGQEGLRNRTCYLSWDEFYKNEPDGLRIAFTNKDGKARQVRDFEEVLTWIKTNDPQMKKESESTMPIYLIFGPEDWGLSNFDLELTHFNVAIPTFGDNPCLNLAQAVLLGLFMLRQSWGGMRTTLEGPLERQETRRRSSQRKENIFPTQILETWLREMGFDLSNQRVNAYSVIRRMLLHNVPSKKELRILELVLQQGIRKLREYNNLRKQLNLPFIKGSSIKDL